MNTENITVEDCLDMYYKKGMFAILEGGQVTGFTNDNVKEIEVINLKKVV